MTCIADTASINLTVAAGQLSADLVVDPGAGLAPNLVTINPAGVYVIGSDGWIPLPTTLAFSSADGHIFVGTTSADLRSFIGPGDKIRLVQSGVAAYYFVHAISAGTITLYGGTDYTLAALPITAPYFSKVKSPIGFPLSPLKWTEQTVDAVDRQTINPAQNVWINPGSISLSFPIGAWKAELQAFLEIRPSAQFAYVTLSTANNSETDIDWTAGIGETGPTILGSTLYRHKDVVVVVKTPYFLNARPTSAGATLLTLDGASSPSIIRIVNAYL